MNYDIRAFLREIALTETYQRRSEMSAELTRHAEKLRPEIETLKANETRLREKSQAAADSLDEAKTAWNEARIAAVVHETAFNAADKKRLAAIDALKKANDALALSEADLQKTVSKTAEGKTDPNLTKLEAAVTAKKKASDTAKTALESAAAESARLKPAVEEEQKKVAAATDRLEAARRKYDANKTAWKLAQRKLKDAEELIGYAGTIRESKPVLEKADRLATELDEVKRNAEARSDLAAALEAAAKNAQTARSQIPEDDDLAMAAAVLGNRSSSAGEKAAAAAKALADKKSEFDAADFVASKLREKNAATLESLTGRWADAFAVGTFTQLTPEQLCAAMLQATGEVDKYRVAGEADFTKKLAAQKAAEEKAEKAPPAKKEEAKDPASVVVLTEADREAQVREYVETRIAASTKRFISLFGGQAGLPQGDFFATADQALFLSNDGTVRAWLRPSGENLSGRLLKMEEADSIASELYLSILTREPDPIELANVKEYLNARGEKKSEAIQELSWALLSSVEFRFKH
jgi:hypothetical protein